MQDKMLKPYLHQYELRVSSGIANISTDLLGTKWKFSAAPTTTTSMVPRPIDANNPIQEAELREVHDRDL
jgi:hypothetical protein